MTGYLGSKAASGAYQAIIALMPPHDTYIETHLGSGAVLQRKPPAIKSIALDLDEEVLKTCSSRLKKIQFGGECNFIHQNAHDFLTEYCFTGRELLYVDPPYLLSTRTSRHRYKHEYTEEDHITLITCLTKINAKVILSGYPNTLYDDRLPGWNTKTFQVMTRGGVRTEKLWFNFEPNVSFWASFAGENFTKRQAIKRKATRWAKKYRELPAGEQRAIMAALLDESETF